MSLKGAYRDALLGAPDGGERVPFLVNDMVIEEQLCHLRCSYCLTEEFNLLMAVPDAKERLTTDHREDWHAILRAFHESIDAPIMRLSGGEFFWLQASDEFVAELGALYETVQVISNGVLLKRERLERLAAIPNFQLNLSLDGHTHEMNRYRFPKQAMHDLVLHHLDIAVGLGIKVEIQAVLTDANGPQIPAFCEYLLARYGDAVRLYYFPVRGKVAGDVGCPPGDYLFDVVDRYDEFAPILPPKPYVEHMADFVANQRRRLPCLVPATMMQLFGNGDISACPHAWVQTMANLNDEPEAPRELVGRHSHYDLFLQPRPRFDFCKGCATPSDVLNLYLQGEVTLDEMARTFLYSGPRSLERLELLRSRLASVIVELSPPPARQRSVVGDRAAT